MWSFLVLAGRSVKRQRLLRQLAAIHTLVLTITMVAALHWKTSSPGAALVEATGLAALLLGIVEGSLLVGWRLAQWPKSQALELLLITSLSPISAMLGEQLAGIALLGLVSLSSLPLMAWGVGAEWITFEDAAVLTLMGWLWGSVTGLGLAWWAYEPVRVRQWGERLGLIILTLYLVVGGLMGEKTLHLLALAPWGLGDWVRTSFWAFHWNNPLALIHRRAFSCEDPEALTRSLLVVNGLAMMAIVAFVARSAGRLKSHYIEIHYLPKSLNRERRRPLIGEAPLTWWAVRRVQQYSGQINVILALGAATLEASYVLLGEHWPSWMGRDVFLVFDQMGGVAGLVTGMVLLSATPAAYQFGLWDANDSDRARRLELLLLSRFRASDYLQASWRAAWSRGYGYLAAAGLLWWSAWWGGVIGVGQALVAMLAAAALGAFYFAVGFAFLARQTGATVGFLLCVATPAAVWGLSQSAWRPLAQLFPPGALFASLSSNQNELFIALVSLATLAISLLLLWRGSRCFDMELRRWYERHHGGVHATS